jgi:hypothetical protein
MATLVQLLEAANADTQHWFALADALRDHGLDRIAMAIQLHLASQIDFKVGMLLQAGPMFNPVHRQGQICKVDGVSQNTVLVRFLQDFSMRRYRARRFSKLLFVPVDPKQLTDEERRILAIVALLS